jgi:hypothetical protein
MSSEIEIIQSMMASLDTHSRQVPDGLYLDMSNQMAKLYNLHGGGGGGHYPAATYTSMGIIFCGLLWIWDALSSTCSLVARVVRGAPIVSKKVVGLDELLGRDA